MQQAGQKEMVKEMKMASKECCLAFQEQPFTIKVIQVMTTPFLPWSNIVHLLVTQVRMVMTMKVIQVMTAPSLP